MGQTERVNVRRDHNGDHVFIGSVEWFFFIMIKKPLAFRVLLLPPLFFILIPLLRCCNTAATTFLTYYNSSTIIFLYRGVACCIYWIENGQNNNASVFGQNLSDYYSTSSQNFFKLYKKIIYISRVFHCEFYTTFWAQQIHYQPSSVLHKIFSLTNVNCRNDICKKFCINRPLYNSISSPMVITKNSIFNEIWCAISLDLYCSYYSIDRVHGFFSFNALIIANTVIILYDIVYDLPNNHPKWFYQ